MLLVRQATAADLPRIMEIAGAAATAAQWGPRQYAQIFSPRRVALVIEEDQQIAGFVIGHGAAAEWEIENIAITGPARRRGLGSRLLGEFLHQIRCSGGKEVVLEVRESNRAAQRFYEKWGFTLAGRRKNYYVEPAEDALVLKFYFPQES